MYDEPKISVIRLVTVPFEIDDKNQLTFSNLQAQTTYFSNLPGVILEDSTYQRKDNIIRYPGIIDDIYQYNYVMYQNTNYNDKWFYAYITSMRYISDSMTEIQIKTDVYQTWFNDIQIKQSFVEREHVNDDTIGLHTVPENLETGDYVNATEPIQSNLGEENYICIAVSDDIIDSSQNNHIYNGIASGLIYMIVNSINALNFILKEYASEGKSSNVSAVFMIPKQFNPSPTWINIPNSQLQYAYIGDTNNSYNLTAVSITTPTKLAGEFEPKNNKLMTFPYRYLLASNNAGCDVTYKYEDFKYSNTTGFGFNVKGNINPGCSIKYVPTYYKNKDGLNYEESFNGAKFPIGSWINDIYTNWLTQNGLNIGISTVGNMLQIIGGLTQLSNGATAIQGASNIGSGIMGITNTVAQVHQHELAPNQVEGNINSSDVMFGVRKIGATFYNMSIKPEYARIIDNYFSMFGYKVNELKIPNITGRRNWNYVKTIDVNIIGAIPQDDLQEIKSIFNKGVTFWHNATTFLDYSQNNDII